MNWETLDARVTRIRAREVVLGSFCRMPAALSRPGRLLRLSLCLRRLTIIPACPAG